MRSRVKAGCYLLVLISIVISNIAMALPVASTLDGKVICNASYIRFQAQRQLVRPYPEFFSSGDSSRIQSWFAAHGYGDLNLYSPIGNPGQIMFGFDTVTTPYSRADLRRLRIQVRDLMLHYNTSELTQMLEQAGLELLCEIFGGTGAGGAILRMTDTTLLAAIAIAKKAQETSAPPPTTEPAAHLAGFDFSEYCLENPGLCCYLPEGPDSWFDELLDNLGTDYSNDGVTERYGLTTGFSLGGGWSVNVGAGFESELSGDSDSIDGGYGSIGLSYGR